MKVIISPSKTMMEDIESKSNVSLSMNRDNTEEILEFLKNLSVDEIKQLMKINDRLANLTKQRFDNLTLDTNGNPAILSYDGLQYKNMDIPSLDDKDMEFLDENIRIISGLYGVLKPYNSIYPYRLEMQTKLLINDTMNLYEYWGSTLYDTLKEESKVIVNLASLEYSKAIKPYIEKDVDFITCVFKVRKGDKLKVESTASKIARGQMVHYIIKNRIQDLDGIRSFKVDGYEFNSELSTENEFVFIK